MGMPVKLSDELVLSARLESQVADRSITAQIEHWAKLGRAAETALGYQEVISLKRTAGNLAAAFDHDKRAAVLQVLSRLAGSDDREDVKAMIRASGKPVYGTDPAYPGMVVREEPDGKRTPGRFVNRQFVSAPETAKASRPRSKAAG